MSTMITIYILHYKNSFDLPLDITLQKEEMNIKKLSQKLSQKLSAFNFNSTIAKRT